MASLKELSSREDKLSMGHRACAGCLPIMSMHLVLRSVPYPVVCGIATGCMEVVSTIYPYTAWNVPLIHNAFENVAATISGVEAAYNVLKKKGKIDKDIKFIAFGGDGGTYDIGLQSLSGALERRHNMLYVCYNNEAYMNTGIQRSGATPFAADTRTAPVGKVLKGKLQPPKNLTEIVIAHEPAYAAQACISHWKDLNRKVEKAVSVQGPSFINILAPCPPGWRYPQEKGIEIARLAVETCAWPLYEYEDGKRKLNYRPKEKKPLSEWTKLQGRFRHLHQEENKELLQQAQELVDRRWQQLLELCGAN
ncbi:MAG: thiamine pyrophosphate-dependent enzyme [candidate division KSB1 bacterium]|nr:thiamine pyrophosphate-dependent enzyme [candidate division KSB1 bacterium]